MYQKVLKSGCRCIERKDLLSSLTVSRLLGWERWRPRDLSRTLSTLFANSQGHTLTSRIKFREVIKVIADYAFVASPYPVILSIELHVISSTISPL